MGRLSKCHNVLGLWANASFHSPDRGRRENLEGGFNDRFTFALLCHLKCYCANRHLMNWLRKVRSKATQKVCNEGAITEDQNALIEEHGFFSFAYYFILIEAPSLWKITCWQFKKIMKQQFSSKHSSIKQTPGFRVVCVSYCYIKLKKTSLL